MAAVIAARHARRAVAGAHAAHPGATQAAARLLTHALEPTPHQHDTREHMPGAPGGRISLHTATESQNWHGLVLGASPGQRSLGVKGHGWYARGTALEPSHCGEEQLRAARGQWQGWGHKAWSLALLDNASAPTHFLSSVPVTASAPLGTSLSHSRAAESHYVPLCALQGQCMPSRAFASAAPATGSPTQPTTGEGSFGVTEGVTGGVTGDVTGGAPYSGQGRRVGGARRAPKFGRFHDREIPVKNFLNEDCGSIKLPGMVFDVPVRKDIVHSVVRWQLAKRRAGTASTLGVGEVRGTSKKPFPQKGTGRARQGTLRAPHMRGGATMHGPKPRSHAHSLPKKVRRLGLRIALSARLAEGKLVVYQDLEPGSHKTREMARHLASAFPASKKFLLVDHVPKETENTTDGISNSTEGSDGAVPTGEVGEAGSGSTHESVAALESADTPPMSQSQSESEAQSEGGAPGQAVKEGFTMVRDVYGRMTLRPWSREERLAHRAARKKAQVHLQKVGERLLKATGNLHYVNVLPTLGLNVYSILQHDTLVMSAKAVQGTIDRLHPKWPSQRERRIMELIEQRRQGQQHKEQQQ